MIYPAYNSDISMQLPATLTVTLIGFLATLILLLAYSLIRSCAGGPPFPVCFRRGAWFLLTAPAVMLLACFIGCNIYVVRTETYSATPCRNPSKVTPSPRFPTYICFHIKEERPRWGAPYGKFSARTPI